VNEKETEKLQEIVVATSNQGKLAEIKHALKDLNIELLSLRDFPHIKDIPETGMTFEENALIKARTVASLTSKIAIADDSGIMVDALEGKPGVFSARFAGENATDEENNRKLLNLLKDVPLSERGATFVCVIAIVNGEREQLVRGECRGFVTYEPKGNLGFGYDPLFYYPPLGKTFAEMLPDEKSAVSHRGRALKKLREILPSLLAGR
jgi:XTP/dITP diphosphohydrolase